MIGKTHRSNIELIGQGIANIFSSVFGGIPATGAIARTATNIKNGGRTPIAGIVHSVTLLLIMLLFGNWAKLIPLSCLAGILAVVSYNMSEYRQFFSILKGNRSDAIVMVVTFLLTVVFDLTIAIEVGIVLAAFLFIRRITEMSKLTFLTEQETPDDDDPEAIDKYSIPSGIEVFEISGPLFFGVAQELKNLLMGIEKPPKILIIRMRKVPIIDATDIYNLKSILKSFDSNGTKIMLSGVNSSVYEELHKASMIGKYIEAKYICKTIAEAIEKSKSL